MINGLIFTAYALASRHVSRDLTPTGKDLRHIGKSVKDHLVLRHPTGEEAKRYNVLQKLAYASILFIVAPLIVLTGLAMSPTIDTAFPWLLTIFGGAKPRGRFTLLPVSHLLDSSSFMSSRSSSPGSSIISARWLLGGSLSSMKE